MKSNLRDFLIQILQIILGNRSELTRQLLNDEWDSLYAECIRQAVVGITFAGVQSLPEEQMPPSALLNVWKRRAEIIRERHNLINRRYQEACERFEKEAVGCCVLMPKPAVDSGERFELREGDSNDVDILCWSKEKKDGKRTIVEYVNFRYISSTHHIKPKVVRQHVDWKTGSFPVDVRFKFSYFNSPLYDRRFLKWVEKKAFSVSPQKGEGGYPVPSDAFNAVYQLIHLYKKLFCEGLRLGHLYDYYMVLCSLPNSEHEEVMRVIKHFGMKKFAGAVMYVLQTVFSMPDEYLLCKPNPKNGSFVLSITLLAGEYTRSIERTRTLKHLGRIGHYIYWIRRNRPFLTQYPTEILFELYRRIRG